MGPSQGRRVTRKGGGGGMVETGGAWCNAQGILVGDLTGAANKLYQEWCPIGSVRGIR